MLNDLIENTLRNTWLGLSISVKNKIPRKTELDGMDSNSVGIPGFRRLKFQRNSSFVPFQRPKKIEFHVLDTKKHTKFPISKANKFEKSEFHVPK